MASNEEVTAFAASVAGVAGEQWGNATAAPSGDLEKLWRTAAAQGWFDLAAADALDAALAAVRQLGRVACPLPVIDGFAAARLLPSLDFGDVRVLVSIGTEGDLVEHAEAATAATHVLLVPAEGGTAYLREIAGVEPRPGLAVPAWCQVRLGATTTSVDIDSARADEAVVLMRLGLAARAIGAAERAHEMAVEHAKTRHQFGRPIGSFGAVQQRTASCQIDVSAGNLLIEQAQEQWAARTADWTSWAEIAVEHVREAAPRVQLGAQHTLAAIGYFEEHEAPWLFRRVHADVTRLRSFPRAAGEFADVLVETDTSLPPFRAGDVGEAFRTEVRALFAEHAEKSSRSNMDVDHELVRAVADRGWFGFAWPAEYGGRDATLAEQVVLNEEAAYSGAPVTRALSAVMLLGNSILKHGSPEQKDRFLPLIRRGELAFCLGYSEPEAGSDLASLKTRAVRDGDGWVINGQKLWTTGGHTADWVWLAVRTDPDAKPRHAGITVFLVPMDTPGITVQQHRALSGEISCTVFYDDVRVPDSARVGEVNGGWKVITDALAGERITMGNIAAALHRQLDDLLAEIRADVDGTVGPRGSGRRALLGRVAVAIQATRALVSAAIDATGQGRGARLEAPMAGVLGGETAEAFGEAALEILGPDAALASAPFEYGLRLSVMYVVGGGTNDIQRGLIARGLGLPR
ncbi:acyl-CoA dehydrogenase family protein [Amycolatopsis thermophila]|uniref:Alkylation response protein AidB-like acyl-CoA dehydrogenase n=1 Tax=Amycolatopsis thermophila TaxID=206084 RepID=A0ABU0F5X1_9PSEU|nr:acyl-CoA dehydrogenase family protein [Amycolatopsis thermophila]MDQ0382778.1 alkylation response protein AidB-like acyl-CoA dehydrogenase [Amycolatopsis thermophila]